LPEPAPAFAPRFKPGLAPLGGLAGALPPSDWLKVDREAAVEVYSSLILFSKSCLSLQRRLRAVLEPATARAASAHAGWSRAQSVAMWMLIVEVRGYRWHTPSAEDAQNTLVIGAAWLDSLSPAFSEYLLEHLTFLRAWSRRVWVSSLQNGLSKSAPMESFTLSSADLTASSVISSSQVLDFMRMKEMLLPRELGHSADVFLDQL